MTVMMFTVQIPEMISHFSEMIEMKGKTVHLKLQITQKSPRMFPKKRDFSFTSFQVWPTVCSLHW